MKIKDIVSLQGCYSAHDVGEQEVKLSLDRNVLDKMIVKWNDERYGRYSLCDHWIESLVDALVSHSGEIIKKGEQ